MAVSNINAFPSLSPSSISPSFVHAPFDTYSIHRPKMFKQPNRIAHTHIYLLSFIHFTVNIYLMYNMPMYTYTRAQCKFDVRLGAFYCFVFTLALSYWMNWGKKRQSQPVQKKSEREWTTFYLLKSSTENAKYKMQWWKNGWNNNIIHIEQKSERERERELECGTVM